MANRPARPKATKMYPDLKTELQNNISNVLLKNETKSRSVKTKYDHHIATHKTLIQTENVNQGSEISSSSNQDDSAKFRGLPRGFATREEMQARIAEKKDGKTRKQSTLHSANRGTNVVGSEKIIQNLNLKIPEVSDKQNSLNENMDFRQAAMITRDKQNSQDDNSKPRGLPRGFASREEMQARIAEKNYGKTRKTSTLPSTFKRTDIVGDGKIMQENDPKAPEAIDKQNTLTVNKDIRKAAKITRNKPKNQADSSKLRGLPRGFATREEMQSRIAEKTNGKTLLSTNRGTAIVGGGVIMQKGDSRVQELSDKHNIFKDDRQAAIISKDKPKAAKSGTQDDSSAILEKSRTYRIPTRGTTDNRDHLKYDINSSSTYSDAKKSEEPTFELDSRRKYSLVNERDNRNTGRLQESIHISATGAEERATLVSARTSHSYSAAPSLPISKSEQLPPTALKIMIMNANGGSDNAGAQAERRKHVIHSVVTQTSPDILLFQEFKWVGITGKTWEKYPIPDHYAYKGHQEASILYDSNCIMIKDLSASEIDAIIGGLQNNVNNRLKKRFPMDFTPIPRMCISQVTSTKSSVIKFIIISWHGQSNELGGRGRMKEQKKIEYFEYLMEFVRHVKEKCKLPVLIAGDFNVDMHSVEQIVQPPFQLCMYDASMRRTIKGILDFFIVSEEIEASGFDWFDIERNTKVFHPTEVLDHDPVSAIIRFFPVAKGKPKFANKNAWLSPKSRVK